MFKPSSSKITFGLLSLLFFLLSTAAHASMGTISGTFTFTQRQGNCGVGTDTKYPCTQKNIQQPVRSAKVLIWKGAAATGTPIGVGYTNSAGQFTASWTDSASTGNVTVTVGWAPTHIDERFEVRSSTGGTIFLSLGGTVTAVNNTDTSVGPRSFGANQAANIYDGAVKMWENSLSQATRVNTYFGTFTPPGTGATEYVQIRRGVDDGSCLSGAAFCSLNRICLPSNAWDMNHSRIMHEMGHVAECVSNRDQIGFPRADYQLNGGGNTWSYATAEWHSAQMGEAVADAFVGPALYDRTASQPFACGGNLQCDLGGFNLHTSSSPCSTTQRNVISTVRYFWDVYDNGTGQDEQVTRAVTHIANVLFEFPVGSGNRQRDEAGPSDPDGHSSFDVMQRWKTTGSGTESEAILTMNCAPTTAGTDNATTTCTPAGGLCPIPE